MLLVSNPLPSPPIVMASETPMVLYCHASIPCFWIESLTVLPRSSTDKELQVRDLSTRLCCCPKTCQSQTYDAYCCGKSARAPEPSQLELSLAWIAFPPNRSHPNVRAILHRLSIRYTCSVKHCLCRGEQKGLLFCRPS